MSTLTGSFGFSQVGEFFNWVGSHLTCASSAEPAFRRTFINKLDDQGQPKVYTVIDKATRQERRTPLLSYIENVETGDLYLDEGMDVVAQKCAAIAIGNPFYAVGTIAWHVIKTPLLMTTIALDTIGKLGRHLVDGEIGSLGSVCLDGILESGKTLGQGIWGIVSTPFYAIGVEFSALYGIFDPYWGRTYVAAFEHDWQGKVSYREFFKKAPEVEGQHCWMKFVDDMKRARTSYLANCFQVRGNTHDARIRVIRTEAL